MSVRLFLSNQFAASEILPANDWVQLLEIPLEYLGEYRLYQGHYSIGIFDLLPQDIKSIVFLRDPVERTLSHLKHLRRDPNFHAAHALAAGRSLEDLVHDDRVMDLCCNTQTAQLSNDIPGPDILDGLRRDREGGTVVNADGYTLEPDLQKAKQNLDRFDYVGFVESLQDDVRQLSAAFGLHPPRQLPRSNDDPRADATSAEVTPEVIRIIRQRNELDLSLYQEASKRPRLSWAACAAGLVRRPSYSPIRASTRFPLSGPIPGSNWYEYEYEDGPSRWTGPLCDTTLDLPLESDRSFEITLSLTSDNLDDFSVSIGQNTIPYECVASEGSEHTISFWITADLVHENGLTTVVFRTRTPTQAHRSDFRTLSFLVRDLRISDVISIAPTAEFDGGFDSQAAAALDAEPNASTDLATPKAAAQGSSASDLPISFNLPIDEESRVDLIGEAIGFFADGWVRSTARFRCRSFDAITSVSLQVWVPHGASDLHISMHGEAEDQVVTLPVERGIISILQFSVNVPGSEEFTIRLTSNHEEPLSKADARKGSYVLRQIVFS